MITGLEKASKMRKVPYKEVKKLEQGVRRCVHDDITVVVIFIDHDITHFAPQLSVRGFVDTVGPSNFHF